MRGSLRELAKLITYPRCLALRCVAWARDRASQKVPSELEHTNAREKKVSQTRGIGARDPRFAIRARHLINELPPELWPTLRIHLNWANAKEKGKRKKAKGQRAARAKRVGGAYLLCPRVPSAMLCRSANPLPGLCAQKLARPTRSFCVREQFCARLIRELRRLKRRCLSAEVSIAKPLHWISVGRS